MADKAKNTPTPWEAVSPKRPTNKDEGLDFGITSTQNGHEVLIAETYGRVDEKEYHDSEANAHLIVQAVNSHTALVDACKYVVEVVNAGYIPDLDVIEKALSLAKGEK